MAETKIVVIYPRPTDVDAFEKLYVEEHVPLAVEKIKGPTKFVATKVVGTADGSTPPFYRIAEFYFPSMQALQDCAASVRRKRWGMPLRFLPVAGRSSWWLNKKRQHSNECGPVSAHTHLVRGGFVMLQPTMRRGQRASASEHTHLVRGGFVMLLPAAAWQLISTQSPVARLTTKAAQRL